MTTDTPRMREFPAQLSGFGGQERYPGGTTKRAPDRVLGGPQSRALSRLIGVDL